METTDKPSLSMLPVSTLTIGGTVIVIDVRIHHVVTSCIKAAYERGSDSWS